ncbi:hypothetical protein ykris0001_24540 [Yersinia kristensenii ATCC 33638]|nr:hypothetical protein ykris0001_24540 [Yersinia kristensenii ATCC 33638]
MKEAVQEISVGKTDRKSPSPEANSFFKSFLLLGTGAST